MELGELGDRLFRLHAKLIIAVFLAGLLGGLGVHMLQDKPQYQANVVFTMGAADPQNAQNAAVLADTARGIATGPQLVATAIKQAGVSRNMTAVATAVNVQTLGSSGVLILSVTDRDPQVAVKLANALAEGVVNTRVALIQNGLASSLQGLTQQEAATNAQIQRLNTRIGNLSAKIAAASPQASGQAPAVAELTQLQARLTSLQVAATQIAVQRNQLQAQRGPKTTVLDKAVSAMSVRGRGLIDALLGGILGLVCGIAIAGAREMMRPSLVGAGAISRAIGAPLLGEMSTPPDSWTLAALPDAGTYIELAADAQHAQEVRFAALDPNGRHRARMRMLEGPLHRLMFNRPRTSKPLSETPHDGPPGELMPAAVATALSVTDPDGKNAPRTGLVVAIPRVLKVADVDAVTNFLWISGWTLLGVIVHTPPRKTIMTIRRGTRSADSPDGSSVAKQVEVDA